MNLKLKDLINVAASKSVPVEKYTAKCRHCYFSIFIFKYHSQHIDDFEWQLHTDCYMCNKRVVFYFYKDSPNPYRLVPTIKI